MLTVSSGIFLKTLCHSLSDLFVPLLLSILSIFGIEVLGLLICLMTLVGWMVGPAFVAFVGS